MMHHERRQYSRKTLNPLPYINLPSDNGGIVLDVSEQGLRFRALAPLEISGPIPFSFTSHSKLVIGIGELVWIDKAKKTGGLRFTQLPYDALEQIRKLPHNTSLRPGLGKDLTLHIPAPDEFPRSGTNERGAWAGFTSKVADVLSMLLPESYGLELRESWLPAARSALAKLRARAPEFFFQKQNRWLVKTAYALFLGIVISTLVYVRHREAGELLIRIGTRLSGGVTTLAPAPTVASLPPSVDDVPLDRSKVESPVAEAAPKSVIAATGKSAGEISAATAIPQLRETAARLPKAGANGKELIVQVAALKEEVDARELSNTLRQENFEAFVGTLPVDSLYRVMLGPYTDEASARVVLGKLKRAGFNSFIRHESVSERLGS